MKIRLLLAVLTMALAVACKNKQEKINDFVTGYNNAAAYASNPMLEHTSAKAISENEIRIILKLGTSSALGSENVFDNIFPPMVAELVSSDSRLSDLLDEGVRIDFVLLAADDSKLTNLVVDRKKADELQEIAETADRMPTKANLSPELQQGLQILNQGLPIVDKVAGTKITSITVDEKMALVYNTEVDDSLAENLKQPGAAELVKETLVRDQSIRKVLFSLRAYGVSSITYKYVDQKGETVLETSLNASDFR